MFKCYLILSNEIIFQSIFENVINHDCNIKMYHFQILFIYFFTFLSLISCQLKFFFFLLITNKFRQSAAILCNEIFVYIIENPGSLFIVLFTCRKLITICFTIFFNHLLVVQSSISLTRRIYFLPVCHTGGFKRVKREREFRRSIDASGFRF